MLVGKRMCPINKGLEPDTCIPTPTVDSFTKFLNDWCLHTVGCPRGGY